MRNFILGCLLLSLSPTVFLQNCSCIDHFEWVKKTFEENDAGFTYALDQKGEDAYEAHNIFILKKVELVENISDCTPILYEWLQFFRSGHIGIRNLNQGGNQNTVTQSDDEIRAQFKDWESVSVNEEEFIRYLQNKSALDYEGVWDSPPYKIGIKKYGDEYLGFVMEADGVYWTKGQIKLRINPLKQTATYYMRDHSARAFNQIEKIGDVFLEVGFISLERVIPVVRLSETLRNYIKSINASEPYVQKISDNTMLLRIPSFSYSEKSLIDSIILANEKLLSTTENLIIDLRNNGGGSDASYQEILPFIYTNPIRIVGVELRSTPLNNKRMEDFMVDPDFTEEDKKWAEESLVLLNKHLGDFVNLDSTMVSVETLPNYHTYPENVGIIVNENCGSTTEQFLLVAKQSKKVKLFGTTTIGVLDISNMYFVNSPCDDFQLGYSLSRSFRIPEMTIDGKGIQPDFYIDKMIPKYKWIEFVEEILSEK